MNHTKRSFLLEHRGPLLELSSFTSSDNEDISSIDECHFTSEAGVVYTYLHFRRQLDPYMLAEHVERRVELLKIHTSYTSSASELVNQYGFKVLLEHLQTQHPCFHTQGRRGLLFRCEGLARLRRFVRYTWSDFN